MKEIIEIASKKGLSEAEVYQSDSVSQEVSFANNNLKNISTLQNSGIGIRGIHNNKIGVCSVTHEADIEKALGVLIDSSQFSEPKEFDFSKPSKYASPKVYDNSIEKVNVDKLVSDGEKIIEKIGQYDKDIAVDIIFSSDIDTTRINNSFGMNGEYKKSSFAAYISGKLIEGTSFIETDCYKYGIDANYDVDTLVDTFVERIKLARNEVGFESGNTNILFTPKALKDILTTVTQGVNGNAVEKGISPLCGRIGETIFDEKFTLIDDATLDNQVGSMPFDDEGTPTCKNYLIKSGVLKSYVHSLKTAVKTNSNPTGNGTRGSYDTPPSPSINNMVIEPGKVSFEEMLQMMGNGIIIDDIMGLSMNNLLNGDFGGNIYLGFKVEKGEIIGRVKNAVFNSNIYKILKNDLIALSNLDYTHAVVNSIFAAKKQPCALFKGINVTIK